VKRAKVEFKEERERGKAEIFYSIAGTLLGIGYIPLAPATAASIIVCILIWFLLKSPLTYLSLIIILFTLGVWISSKLVILWGEDNRRIVIDESVGMLITLFMIPQRILFFLIGFFLFRFFDIVKPYPINESQNLKNGWGVVMDDVIAGMYSSIILWIFIFFYHLIQ